MNTTSETKQSDKRQPEDLEAQPTSKKRRIGVNIREEAAWEEEVVQLESGKMEFLQGAADE